MTKSLTQEPKVSYNNAERGKVFNWSDFE
jgi:hypothetical protein